MRVWSRGQEESLEQEKATHSSILAWKIPWTEETGRLQSMGLQRVVHDWTHTDTCTILRENSAGLQMGCNISVTSWIFVSRVWCVLFCPSGEGNGNPLQYSCLENPVGRGAWWAAVDGVTQNQSWLKQLSMHACIGEGNGKPLQYSCLENPWWAAVYGVAKSWTRRKQLNSSSSILPFVALILIK